MSAPTEAMAIAAIEGISERLHKANAIASLIRVAGKEASDYALENAAWAIEGLLDEVHELATGESSVDSWNGNRSVPA